MAFNFGAFASGAAKGYLSAKELEEKEKDRAMRQQALDIQVAAAAREEEKFQRDREAQQILKEAYTPTEGGVSTAEITSALPIGQRAGEAETTPDYRQAFQSAFSKLTPEQQAGVLQGYGSKTTPGGQAAAENPLLQAAQLGTTTVRRGEGGQTYAVQPLSDAQAADRYAQLAGASGNTVALEKAIDLKAKQQQLKLTEKQMTLADMSITAAKREENYRNNLDTYTQNLIDTQNILEALPNVGLRDAPALVNGQLKDFGLTAKYIHPTGDAAKKQAIGGVATGVVEVRDTKGNVVGTFKSVSEIQAALNAQMDQYQTKVAGDLVRMLPNPADRIKFMNEAKTLTLEKAKVDIMNRNADASAKSADAAMKNAETNEKEMKAKIDSGLFGAQASQANAAANASNAHAAVYKNMAALAKSNAEAGKVMKPYIEEFAKLSPEDQAGAKGQSILLEAATAAAKKTGDVTSIINALKKPDRSTVTTEERNAAYRDLENAGTDSNQIALVKEKWPNVFGEDPMVTAFKDAQKNKGNPAQKPAAEKQEKSAIPPADNKRYIREKNSRGIYVYTESPRGMTKDAWNELDKKQTAIPTK